MKREKEIPAELLEYIKNQKAVDKKMFKNLNMFCRMPVRAVRMKMLAGNKNEEDFLTSIIPPVDIYVTGKAELKNGFLKRDALSYFIKDTHKAFPYGHVYASSGYICLGSIFVPSAVPERSAAIPLETLFLHNDRNLSHGHSCLSINEKQADDVKRILQDNRITLNALAECVIEKPNADIIQNDEIWNLSQCVASQRSLPDALHIMADVYDIIFEMDKNVKKESDDQI